MTHCSHKTKDRKFKRSFFSQWPPAVEDWPDCTTRDVGRQIELRAGNRIVMQRDGPSVKELIDRITAEDEALIVGRLARAIGR